MRRMGEGTWETAGSVVYRDVLTPSLTLEMSRRHFEECRKLWTRLGLDSKAAYSSLHEKLRRGFGRSGRSFHPPCLPCILTLIVSLISVGRHVSPSLVGRTRSVQRLTSSVHGWLLPNWADDEMGCSEAGGTWREQASSATVPGAIQGPCRCLL